MKSNQKLLLNQRGSACQNQPSAPCISSASNHIYKDLLALQTTRGINKQRRHLAGGSKLLREIARQNPQDILGWVTTPTMELPAGATQQSCIYLSKSLFNTINCVGTAGPLAIMRLPDLPEFDPQKTWPAGCTLFIPFGDPENVGAVLRSAAALGAARVVLLRDAASPFLPRAIRAAAGATWKIRMETGPFLKDFIPAPKIHCYALDINGVPLHQLRVPAQYGLLAGAEGPGLPSALKTELTCAAIPLKNQMESLNAATAVALALWTWQGKLRIKNSC